MRNSNLAERLEVFLASAETTVVEPKTPHVVAVADPVRRPPRRLTLTTRRILARDADSRPFRVF